MTNDTPEFQSNFNILKMHTTTSKWNQQKIYLRNVILTEHCANLNACTSM